MFTNWQSGREKPESAGKGCRVEKQGEEIQKDPAAQHKPGSVFHTGKSNRGFFLRYETGSGEVA